MTALLPTRRRRRRLTIAVAVMGAALAAALAAFLLRGGAWYVVETPSMGVAAPVGTLVVSAPVRPSALHVGDIVTYAPPTGASTITHRVVSLGPEGIRTRGDVNGSDDPWILTGDEIRGRAVATVPAVGWLVRMLPLLVGGLTLVLGGSAVLRDHALRTAVRLVGTAVVVCATVLLLRPLVNAATTTVLATPAGTVVGLAGTGLLPVRVSTASGAHVDLTSGTLGVLHLPPGSLGRIDLVTSLHLDPLGWTLFAALCAAPIVVAAVRCRRPGPTA